MKIEKARTVKVADEVWIATALLHRENPERDDFSVDEIVDRARREGLHEELRPGVRVHVLQHCVANRAPDPGRYCMLTETGKMRRRLWRSGDPVHPKRIGAKSVPQKSDIPEEYSALLDWYHRSQSGHMQKNVVRDPILKLRGLGREISKGVDSDEYVRKLREGWE